MNARERFLAVMDFEPVDRTLCWEFGYWIGAVRRWYGEGLPLRYGVADTLRTGDAAIGESNHWDPTDGEASRPLAGDIHEYFDMDEGMRRIPLKNYLWPAFTSTVLEDHGDWHLVRDGNGLVARVRKDHGTVPEYVDWPVATRDDWERLKAERLRPTLQGRLPNTWSRLIREYRDRTYPLGFGGRGGFYGTPRFLLGAERVLTVFYDDPDLMRDIIDYLADFWVALYDQVLAQTSPDFALIWEDMCYRAGPLISPALFREFMLPAYRRLTGCFRDHGIKHILLDTDGNCWKLIPLFLEGGVTGLYPFEVNAGMDVVAVRRAFPRLQILGGMDKLRLMAGPAEIDGELAKAEALIPLGGFIPFVDHLVPPEVPWEHFRYYRAKLNRLIHGTPVQGQSDQ